MEDSKILQSGLEALDSIAKELGAPYEIKKRFRKWGYKQPVCTITICNKSFTEYGEGCMIAAIKKVVFWAIETYSKFSDLRPAMEEALKPKPEPCLPWSFNPGERFFPIIPPPEPIFPKQNPEE